MEEKLKAGDVVALKSDKDNSLLMTIESVDNPDSNNPTGWCIWTFAGKVESRRINLNALKKV